VNLGVITRRKTNYFKEGVIMSGTTIRERLELLKSRVYEELNELMAEINGECFCNNIFPPSFTDTKTIKNGSQYLQKYKPTKHQRAYRRIQINYGYMKYKHPAG